MESRPRGKVSNLNLYFPELLTPETLKGRLVDWLRVPRALKDLLVEWRFVPRGWTSPFPHHFWYEFDWQRGEEFPIIQEWKRRLKDCVVPVPWYGEDGEVVYSERVDFHLELRPVLVVIGGIQ